MRILTENPSLRGITMGYFAEVMFEDNVLRKQPAFSSIGKDDDHQKSKSDRRFVYRDREYTIQLKSIQTNSLRDEEKGRVTAIVQNDASDRRDILLPTGKKISTTCYLVAEYDILAVPLFPFTGDWSRFAFRRNRDLPRSRHRGYSPEERESLLATAVRIEWPLDEAWTTKLVPMLDKTLGRPVGSEPRLGVTPDSTQVAPKPAVPREG